MNIQVTTDHKSMVHQMIADSLYGIVPFSDMKSQVETYCKENNIPVSTLNAWIIEASNWPK